MQVGVGCFECVCIGELPAQCAQGFWSCRPQPRLQPRLQHAGHLCRPRCTTTQSGLTLQLIAGALARAGPVRCRRPGPAQRARRGGTGESGGTTCRLLGVAGYSVAPIRIVKPESIHGNESQPLLTAQHTARSAQRKAQNPPKHLGPRTFPSCSSRPPAATRRRAAAPAATPRWGEVGGGAQTRCPAQRMCAQAIAPIALDASSALLQPPSAHTTHKTQHATTRLSPTAARAAWSSSAS